MIIKPCSSFGRARFFYFKNLNLNGGGNEMKIWKKSFALFLSVLLIFSVMNSTVSFATNEKQSNEKDGFVIISVEKFTLGQGYYIEPIKVPFSQGEKVGQVVARVLGSGNYNNGVDEENIVYLSNIKDNDTSPVQIPQYILDEIGTVSQKQQAGWLGEFDYSFMSGWMYLVNNEMAPVGMSEYVVSDGDVIRLQFTLYGYGADLGFGYPGFIDSLIEVANKDALTAKVAEINSHANKNELLSNQAISEAYNHAYTVLTNMESSQASVDEALTQLIQALELLEVDKSELDAEIKVAKINKDSVIVSTDGTDIDPSKQWVSKEVMNDYETAIEEAEKVADNAKATQKQVDDAVSALKTATETFNAAKKNGTKKDSPSVNIKEIETAIVRTVEQMLSSGVTSEWQAIGIAKAGYQVPAGYKQYFNEHVSDQIIHANRKKITDIERLVLAAGAIGIDATNVNGVNLVDLIYNSEDWPNGTDSMIAQGNNGPIFALIALDSLAYEVPKDARWTREKLVDYLLTNQNANGSWSLFGTIPNYDITAMALIALSQYKHDSRVQEAIDKAVQFLSDEQGASGGYDDPFSGGVSSETTSQVIIGLTAVGIDPTSEAFTKNDITLIDHLLSYQIPDGSFEHIKGYGSDGMATEQALQALVAYKLFLNGEGSLYQFAHQVNEPIDPSQPKVPSEPISDDSNEIKKPSEEKQNDNFTTEKLLNKKQIIEGKTTLASDNEKKSLPKTATAYYNVFVVGMIILAISLIIFIYERQNRRKGEY